MAPFGPREAPFRLVCTVGGKAWLAYGRHHGLIWTHDPFHFFLLHGPCNQRWVMGAISGFPTLAPPPPLFWPYLRGLSHFQAGLSHFQASVGWLKNRHFWVTCVNPWGPLGIIGGSFGDNDIMYKAMGSHVAPTRPF